MLYGFSYYLNFYLKKVPSGITWWGARPATFYHGRVNMHSFDSEKRDISIISSQK